MNHLPKDPIPTFIGTITGTPVETHTGVTSRVRPLLLPVSSLLVLMVVTSCATDGKTLFDRKKLSQAFWGCPPADEQQVAEEPAPAKEETRQKGLGELQQGSLAALGGSAYLDKMYDGMKKHLEESGLKMQKIPDGEGIAGDGARLEKIKDEKKKTKEILFQFDGDLSFATGSSALTPKAVELIDRLGEAMKAYPETEVTIYGHTDSVGSKDGNRRLSRARAESVSKGLQQRHKISRSRIVDVAGYADDRRIIDTLKAEPRNRRVEIRLTPARRTIPDESRNGATTGCVALR